MFDITVARTMGPGSVEMTTRSFPVLKSGEVCVRVEAAGICGSDIAIYKGDFASRIELPCVLGHEWSGTVVDVADDVTRVQPGDRVVSEEIFSCGDCDPCRQGHFDYCVQPEELGFTVDGAHASHVVLPARYCHVIPDTVSFEAAAMVEPLGVAYNAIYHAGPGIAPGQRVFVSGLGPIGLSAGLWAKASGAEVIGIEQRPFRCELAAKMGFHDVVQVGENFDALRELGPGDMLVEASGDHRVVGAMLSNINPKGAVVTVGHTTKPVEIWLEPVTLKGLTVVGSIGQIGANSYPRMLHALEIGAVDPTPMITHRFALADAPQAMHLASTSEEFAKILFTVF